MVLGLIGLLTVTSIPVVTGVAEGVSEQKAANREAANESRMVKFHLRIRCDHSSKSSSALNGGWVTLSEGKVYVSPPSDAPSVVADTEGYKRHGHPFTGFYVSYPTGSTPAPRGLVSTISNDPPMLNWIFVEKGTNALRHGNRTQSIEHTVGSWDWTDEDLTAQQEPIDDGREGSQQNWIADLGDVGGRHVTIMGWEGFVAAEEVDLRSGEILLDTSGHPRWVLLFDVDDDGFASVEPPVSIVVKDPKSGKKRKRRMVEVQLERHILPTEKQGLEEKEKERKEREERAKLKTYKGDIGVTGDVRRKNNNAVGMKQNLKRDE